VEYPPSTLDELERAQPIYETLPGWSADLSGARHVSDLPVTTRAYIERIGELCGTPVRMVSVGPERDQVVYLD
jgi:adenylosuccinate synthase